MKTINKNLLNVVREKGKVVGFDISRKFWGTGDEGGSLLDASNGKMCCLGFYSLACGAPKRGILDASYLTSIEDTIPTTQRETTKWLNKRVNMKIGGQTTESFEGILAHVNDCETGMYKSRSRKEARIKSVFKQNGITVNFVD